MQRDVAFQFNGCCWGQLKKRSFSSDRPYLTAYIANPNRENRELAQLVNHSHEIRFRVVGPLKFEEQSLRRLSQFVFVSILSIITTIAAANDKIAVGPWRGEGYLDVHANVCSARTVLKNQDELWFALACKRTVDFGMGRPLVCANQQYSVSVALKRSGWGLSAPDSRLVTISVDNFHFGKKNAVATAADSLSINLGPERAIRGPLERGAFLTIDIGKEELKYPLSDMQPLLSALTDCLGTLSDPKYFAPPPGPTEEETLAPPPSVNAADTIGSPDLQSCATQDFVIFHGSLSHEPTGNEREELREYTDSVAPCISVWKTRCGPYPLFPSGSTYAMCEINTDYALAHVNNRRELENRHQNYLEYNSRAHEIDRIFTETTNSFFASVQKPLDDYKEQQRQEQDARDRQAAARREQDLIDALRRLGTPRTVTTQCTSGIGSVQCVSN